jgi:hypothetical protein
MVIITTIYFQKQGNRIKFYKVILSFIAIILTLYPFAILQLATMHIVFNEQLAWIISFGVLFIAGIWFYRLNAQSIIHTRS